MIRHIALFRFKDDVSTDDIDRLDAGLGSLPGKVPSIRGFTTGRDLGINDETWDYAVVADFDDIDGYRAYHEHPAHVDVVTTLTKPLTADLKRVQFEIG